MREQARDVNSSPASSRASVHSNNESVVSVAIMCTSSMLCKFLLEVDLHRLGKSFFDVRVD